MASFTATIKDPVGLHARPASMVVSEASKFSADLEISAKGRQGNLKSIMNVMAMGIRNGDSFTIEASGTDAEQAITSIEKAMKSSNLI